MAAWAQLIGMAIKNARFVMLVGFAGLFKAIEAAILMAL